MLIVPFYLNTIKYAVTAAQVIEVIPFVALRKIPHTPAYIAGVFNYRGSIVPVVDLSLLLYTTPCAPRLGTRILLMEYVFGKDHRLLGLLAERVVETMSVADNGICFSAVSDPGAQYLGGIITGSDEIIQLIRTDELLTDPLSKILFSDSKVNV